jgi:hypothetical protein
MNIVRYLLIQSLDWMLGTTDDYVVKIPLMGIGQVSILSANIPNTLYNITATNNIIYRTPCGALSANIPVGTYSITDLCLALVTIIDSTIELKIIKHFSNHNENQHYLYYHDGVNLYFHYKFYVI